MSLHRMVVVASDNVATLAIESGFMFMVMVLCPLFLFYFYYYSYHSSRFMLTLIVDEHSLKSLL